MNLYYIEQDEVTGYDTFSDAVVAAETEDEARRIHPANNRHNTYSSPRFLPPPEGWDDFDSPNFDDDFWNWRAWTTDPAKVRAKLLGKAAEGVEAGVICASFHAG